MKSVLLLLIACSLITGCSKKEILQGKREAINGITFTDLDVINSNLPNIVIRPNTTDILNQNVRIIWSTSLDKRPISSNLIVNNNYIYTVSGNGTLYCLDIKTGNIIWEYQLVSYTKSSIFSGLLICNNGVLYIGTNTNEVFAFDTKAKKVIWKQKLDASIKSLFVYNNNKLLVITENNSTSILDISSGKMLYTTGLDREKLALTRNGDPIFYKNNVICVYSSGEIVSFDLTNNTTNWSNVLVPLHPYNSGDSILHIAVSPILIGNNILVTNANSVMALLDAESGLKLWEKSIGCVTRPIVINNKWIVALTNKYIVCLDVETGDIKWKFDLLRHFTHKIYKHASWYGPLLINNQIWVFNAEADIVKINVNNGTLIDKQHTHHVLYTDTPYIFNGVLLATVKNKIFALQ